MAFMRILISLTRPSVAHHPPEAGDQLNMAVENSINFMVIQPSSKMVVVTMAMILGTNTSVCS